MDILTQAIANGLTLGAIYAITSIGFAVIFTTTKTFHFAHGGVYLWAAYVMSVFIGGSTGLWLALVAGLVVAVVIPVAIEIVVYQYIRRRRATRLHLFVAALGLLTVLQSLIIPVFGTEVRAIRVPELAGSVTLGGTILQRAALAQFVCAALMLAFVVAVYRWTQFGRSLRAVASNLEMATLTGINPQRTYILAFAFGSALLVPAALLSSITTGLDPGLGGTITMMTLISVIVGGVGSIPGAALGGWLIGLSQTLSTLVLPLEWQTGVAFGVLIVFILIRPNGILGERAWEIGV